MDETKHKLHHDKTFSGHRRVTCLCGKTVVRQPYMTNDQWHDCLQVLKNHKNSLTLKQEHDRVLS
jgi:hypothetical protein